MPANSLSWKTSKLDNILDMLKKDIVFTSSLILSLGSCFFVSPKTGYVDFKVLACLFNLMITVKAFEELCILDKFAVYILNKCTSSRQVSLMLILLSFFTSMFITNDVALITLVPLTLIISRKSSINMLVTVILQTLAANIGSSLTPMGNPQNLYIFSYYRLEAVQFFVPVIPFVLTGLIWLYILNFKNHNLKLNIVLDKIAIGDKIKTSVWAVLFTIIVLSVFEVVDYRAAFVLTMAAAILINQKLIYKIDYLLLITFVCFFVFIGNLSNIPAIDSYMKATLYSERATYFSSIILSQFISNVPCSIFLSKFTPHWRELLLGVNIGGMGTIIASLSSVISYKLYIKENPGSSKEYMIKFSIYNFLSLLVFIALNYLLLFRILS